MSKLSMEDRVKRVIAALTVVGLFMVHNADAVPLNLLSDTIAYNAGIHATANWGNDDTSLSWVISPTGGGLWHYEYLWNTSSRDLSHIIIEISEGAVGEDFSNWLFTHSGVESGSPEIRWYAPSNPGASMPGLPAPFYGLKLDLDTDTTVFGFSFETWRAPVWGSFYAKNGAMTGPFPYAYNLGLGSTPNNQGLHIGLPNGEINRVPDGGLTLGLLGLSVLGLGYVRRRLAKD